MSAPDAVARVAYVLDGREEVVRSCSLTNWPAIRALFDWGPEFHQISRAWLVGSLV